jgi:predicted NACHT family NTPase
VHCHRNLGPAPATRANCDFELYVLGRSDMDRIVRKIETTPQAQEDEVRPISAYDNAANIVLLGDPGAGKTYTFRQCAARSNGRYVTARAFLVTPAAKFDGILFIDGLDEKRAGRSDRDTVDALVEKLFAVSPRGVRISCRIADWLGESDLAALRPYFELSGDPVVLQLARLSHEEQRIVLQAEGLSAAEAEALLSEANERALTDFLENPQNLIMLLRAVQTGKWPATRKELFELSTRIMLKEFDKHRARSGSGVYTVDEVRPAAGALCAARLISDIEAISLADHETSAAIPSYRSLTLLPPERVIAALSRRVFVANSAPESVDYAHRTTAEYLGAAWLADAVRNGMPLNRLQALMGIDGHPAPELRGLNAWLAVHLDLPEHVDRLIDADPYGVLTYGDAASLTTSSCAHLMKALGKLSETDPWFRSGNWQSPAIAALSRADMVEEFRAVLLSPTSGFGVRSIVVEAAALGAPIPALKDDLSAVLQRIQSPYAERLYALIGLLRMGPEGETAAATVFDKLGADENALRLRAEMIRRMYGKPFGPVQVLALLKDMVANSGNMAVGTLYVLAERLPVGDIASVLDGLEPAKRSYRADHRNQWEVARFIDLIMTRAWKEMADIEPVRALQWLRLRHSYSAGYNGSRTNALLTAIRGRLDLLRAVTNQFFEALVPDDNRWLRLTRFREVTFFQVTPEEMLEAMLAHMTRSSDGSDKELFLYEASFAMNYSMDGPRAQTLFERLFALADNRVDLRSVRDAAMSYAIPRGSLDRPPRDDADGDGETQRRNFERDADAIRSGAHLGWLTWAAQVYFGLFSDLDEAARPRERLNEVLGEANAQTAVAGLLAALSRNDFPVLSEVAALSAQHQQHNWWLVVSAGMMERWETNPTLAGLSDEFLKAALAHDLTNPHFEEVDGSSRVIVPGWKTAALQERPELAHEAYVAVAKAKLAQGEQMVDGLRELMVDNVFEPFRGDTALEFLRDFPNAAEYRLNELFDGIFAVPATHQRFLDYAKDVLSGATPVDQRQYDMWLAAAYLLAPGRYESRVEAVAALRPGIIFDLRDRTGYSHNVRGNFEPGAMALPQLEFLTRLTGARYPETSYPTGGWGGDRNAWDAAEYCRKLISDISAIPSQAATEVLTRLEANTQLGSYNAYLRHALANQQKSRRDSEYDRPDWPSAIKALSNGPPATVADLHALLLDQLDDLRKRIARENTDIYKFFWNLDSHSRPKSPKPEEACRDTLVTLLRPALAPKGITVEPEGHMVADKRADISVAMPGRKILCELKRDYHADLWTAADQQLERFYAHDPEAKGFGIYGVLWFGKKRSSSIPKHPDGLKAPESSADLERMLWDRIPVDRRNRLSVLIIDVSGPPVAGKKRGSSSAKKKKKSSVAKKTAARRGNKASQKTSKKKRAAKKASSKSNPRRRPSRQ